MATTKALEVITECAPSADAPKSSVSTLEGPRTEDDGKRRSYVLYIGNLNPRYSREVLCSMLKDILGTASVTLQRHNIEVVKKRKEASAFVQVATEVNLENILKQLLLATDTEQGLVKELVKKGKTLVVGQGKKFGQDDREVKSIAVQ